MFDTRLQVRAAVLVSCALVIPSGVLHAQDLANGWGPSPIEIAKLPNYCQAFFREKKLPPNCDGVHHLCAGKVLINRTMDYSIPKRERQRILVHAKKEVDYIFGRQNASCAFMDEARATQRMIASLETVLR